MIIGVEPETFITIFPLYIDFTVGGIWLQALLGGGGILLLLKLALQPLIRPFQRRKAFRRTTPEAGSANDPVEAAPPKPPDSTDS